MDARLADEDRCGVDTGAYCVEDDTAADSRVMGDGCRIDEDMPAEEEERGPDAERPLDDGPGRREGARE